MVLTYDERNRMIPAHVIHPLPLDQAAGLIMSIILPLFSATAGSGFLGLAY